MTMEVRGPGGIVVRFPDGTDAATVDRVMREAAGRGQSAAPPPNAGVSGGPPSVGPQSGDVSVESVGRALATGTPVLGGFLNRMDAATNATLAPIFDPILPESFDKLPEENWADRYAHALAIQEAKDQAFASEHPYVNAGINIAGGIGGLGALVKAVPALAPAFGIGRGQTIPTRMAASAGSGGILGALDAGVRSGGDPDAMTSGLFWGGLIGGAAPPVARVAGQGLGALYSGIRSGMSQFAAPLTRAAQLAGRAAGDDGITAALAAARLQELGPEGMALDLGPNLQRQAGRIAALPGEGQRIVRGAIADRAGGAGQRIEGAASQAMGRPVNTLQLADEIAARQRASAAPLYQSAYATPLPIDIPELQAVLASPSGRRAWSQASRLAADEGNPISQSVPTVRAIDLTKRSLDDMIGEAQRSGRGNEARILMGLRDRLVGAADRLAPDYAAARAAYAGHQEVLDAIEAGRGVFARNLTPAQLQRLLTDMTPSEIEAFSHGAREAVADIMGTARNDALAAQRLFESGYNQEKLGLLIGEDAADDLLGRLGAERTFRGSQDVVTRNSETAARQASEGELPAPGQQRPAGVLRSLVNFKPGDAAAIAAGRILQGLTGEAAGAVSTQLARLLTATGPERDDAIQRILRAIESNRRALAAGEHVGNAGQIGIGAIERQRRIGAPQGVIP